MPRLIALPVGNVDATEAPGLVGSKLKRRIKLIARQELIKLSGGTGAKQGRFSYRCLREDTTNTCVSPVCA